MRIKTRLEYRLVGDAYVLVREDGFDYDGPLAECKGDQTAKDTELLQQQNMQSQMAFNSQLMGIFSAQFDKQQQVLAYLQGKMQPMVDNPQGYSPAALAAMRTGATDQLSRNYQSAQQAIQAQQFARGGRDLPSGVDEQINAQLMQQEAADKAGAQNSITLQDENLKQANYWNAINELNGVGASFAPQSYAGEATGAANSAVGAGNSVAGLSQAYTASQQSGLMGMLGGLAGGVFGAAGNAASGGATGGLSALFGCWVAAAHFGEDFETGARTNLVRGWLWTEFRRRWYGRPVLWLYAKAGRRIAGQPLLVKLLGPLFDAALRRATGGK